MDTSLRHTPGLIARIERLRDELIKRFESLVGHAGIDRTDRTLTAVTQYQMQVETAALIRAAEDFQSLVRQLQEMWLFGQLDTLGDSAEQQQTDEDAVAVAELLERLVARSRSGGMDVNGEGAGVGVREEKGDDSMVVDAS